MEKYVKMLLISILLVTCTACGAKQEISVPEPEIEEMKAICELSVMDCYYHNVAKYFEENASGVLFWQKDKKFWIEYGGVVKLGIDASLVNMSAEGDHLTITMPEAKVLSCTVDEKTLTEESYIVDQNSAKIDAEDEISAFEEAQKQLEENASNDTAMLLGAQQRAKSLIKDYIKNIGEVTGKTYTIEWVYVDENGVPLEGQEDAPKNMEQNAQVQGAETAA